MGAAAEIQNEKKKLRAAMLAARRNLTASYREKAGRVMIERLCATEWFQRADALFLHASMPDEVPLYPLMARCLAAGKRVGLPWITGPGSMDVVNLPAMDALVPGKFGIQTVDPARRTILPADSIDLIIVPGAAFDDAGNRLGLGAGYYDRFMAERAPQAHRVALAFECQMAARIPVEPHDQRVDCVITEKRMVSDEIWR